MPHQVPEQVKHERIERLVERVQHHARQANLALVGTTQEVLVEGPSRTDEAHLRGRTRTNKTVVFTGDAAEGELVGVVVDGATSMTLRGSVAPAPVAA
jgi:tRNA-2-methylthio-N6-dimethylallyladenosine synthase